VLRLRLGVRKAVSTGHWQFDLGVTDSSIDSITREGNAAIYEQTFTGCSNPSVCYEVVRIRRREGFHIGARFVEPAEVYPNSEAWGLDGFTVTDRDAAFARLRELA
jgi:hypothetical protein